VIHKDRAALAGKVVAKGFFWIGENGDRANKRKSGIDNLAVALGLDRGGDEGWETLAGPANEGTLEPIPDKKGVMCTSAAPIFDQKAAEQTAKATDTRRRDWGYPVKGSLDVYAAGQQSSAVAALAGHIKPTGAFHSYAETALCPQRPVKSTAKSPSLGPGLSYSQQTDAASASRQLHAGLAGYAS
jgi:hypothetical protein